MKSIRFSCQTILPLSPEELAEQILDLPRWPDFQGYGLIPGIQQAEWELRKAEIVGSRIRVTNLDGSSHVEEIIEWLPNHCLRLHMQDFSKPLSFLATGFLETWKFKTQGEQTQVIRSFELRARSIFTVPFLWLISQFLKRASTRHLQQMQHSYQQQLKTKP